MAIFEFNGEEFKTIEKTNFATEGILERKHIQAALKNKIEIVVPDCLVISEEFSDWSNSKRRIDLLGINKSGDVVVIELKRTETGEQMELQALRYASMVSTLTFRKAVEIFQSFLPEAKETAEQKILDFLEWDEPQEDDFNNDVKIILVSADFSKELTTSVLWLNERNIDIKCVRVFPYKHNSEIFVDIQQIIPLPEAENYQVQIRKKAVEQRSNRESNRDFTKYQFNEEIFNKRKLVLAVIQDWISKNKPENFPSLLEAFPNDTRKSGLFVKHEVAMEIYNKNKIYRHFLGNDELIHFNDGSVYAISNQWGKGNIERFLNRARILEIEIVEI